MGWSNIYLVHNVTTAQSANSSSNAIFMQDPDGIRIEVYLN